MQLSEYVVLDLETTGLSPELGDKIIEVAAIRVKDGKVIDTLDTMVHPEVEIPSVVTAITSITNEDVSDAPVFDDIRDTVGAFVGDLPIMGHNIGFDINFLRHQGLLLEKNVPVDTFLLATLFMTGEQSYSLDVLSHKLDLTQGTHRALDDVMACNDLYEHCMSLYAELSDSVQGALHGLFQNSSHDLRILFDHLPSIPAMAVVENMINSAVVEFSGFLDVSKKTDNAAIQRINQWKQICEQGDRTVFSYPLGARGEDECIDVYGALEGQSVVAFTNETALSGFIDEHARDSGAYSFVIDRPASSLLSLPRVLHLASKTSYSAPEAMVLGKILLGLFQGTFRGFQQDIKLIRDEFGVWNGLSCTNDDISKPEEIFLQDYLLAKKDVQLLLTTHHGLIEHVNDGHYSDKNVGVLRGQYLPRSLSFAAKAELSHGKMLGIILNLESIKEVSDLVTPQFIEETTNLVDILWGHLGVWFQHQGGEDQDFNAIPFSSHYVGNSYYVRVLDAFEKILSRFEKVTLELEDKEPALKVTFEKDFVELQQFYKAFSESLSPFLRQFEVRGDDTLVFVLFSEDLHRQFNENLKHLKSFVICHPGGDLVENRQGVYEWKVFPRMFPLTTSNPVVADPQTALEKKLLVLVPEDIPDPNNSLFFRESSKLLISLIRYFGGRLMGAFASRNVLERIFQYVYPLMKEEDIHVYVEGLSGSFGKVSYHYLRDEEHSVLLGTNSMMDKLPSHQLHLHGLIMQKLPFAMTPKGLHVSDKDLGFMDFALPMVAMNLRSFISHAVSTSNDYTIVFLLDKRLVTTGYGATLQEALGKVEVQEVPMSQMKMVIEQWKERMNS